MAIAAVPTNLIIQQGNGQVLLSWDQMATATSYSIQRSTDNITFTPLGTALVNRYLDTTPVVGTLYYYNVASVNGSGTSAYTSSANIIASPTGKLALGLVRALAQQKADMEGSQYVTTPEWNTYINQSYFELYDLLVSLYEDYYSTSYTFTTDGTTTLYALPADFYKLRGVDCGVGTSGFVTLRRFNFENRNQYVYPNAPSILGQYNLRYRVMGNSLLFQPTASAGQTIKIWYIPRVTQLLQDTDLLDGISGWTEYVVVDAAIKALLKEESDVTGLAMQKQMLMKRIEESASNRDAGEPETITDVRSLNSIFDGGMAGF